jgi:hypothetical protein
MTKMEWIVGAGSFGGWRKVVRREATIRPSDPHFDAATMPRDSSSRGATQGAARP